MNRDYDIFEELPNGSTVWQKTCVVGTENVELKLENWQAVKQQIPSTSGRIQRSGQLRLTRDVQRKSVHVRQAE